MDRKTRQEFIHLFNQGFEEVVLPQIEEIKEDVVKIQEDINGMKVDVSQIKGDLNRVSSKMDYLSDRSLEQEARIKKLETVRI